jgi:hypothetical protein
MVFRSSDEPNDLIVLAEYEDAARARQFFQTGEFREANQRVWLVLIAVIVGYGTKGQMEDSR